MDFMQWCLGDIAEVAGASTTQVKEGTIAECGEEINVTSFDTVAFAARLSNGAVGSVYTTWASLHDSGWLLEAYGTEGSLVASATGAKCDYLALLLCHSSLLLFTPDEYEKPLNSPSISRAMNCIILRVGCPERR